jgi:hypothetical protein
MPGYKNQFSAPQYVEETILDASGTTIGTVRIKPSSILWKPSAGRKFYSVSLDKFSAWIISPDTGAKLIKS